MTGPLSGGSLGDAYITVHADTEPVEGDIRRGLKKAGKDTGPDATKTGTTVGDAIGKGVEKEVDRHGPMIARSLGMGIEKATEGTTVKTRFRYDVRGRDGRFVSRAAAGIREEIEEAFGGAAGGIGGSFFKKIGQGFADAIGAGFNVSGRSPLIGILAPLYAAIAGLVIAAIQAANGVVAALLAIPAALSVLLVEFGVLYLAFKGLGTAIQGAFAATNAKELNEALKNLTPNAQSFVKALIPAKGLFAELGRLAQENFFWAFGGGERITALIKAVTEPLKRGIPVVAASLGDFFEKLAMFFSSPLFADFIDRIFPAVAQIVNMLGGPFIDFLLNLFVLIVQSLPFLLELTRRFGDLLILVGDVLGGVKPEWLNEMVETLDSTFQLIGDIITLLAVLFSQVNAAGGQELIEFLAGVTRTLTALFSTEFGKEALQGLIKIAEVGILILLGLVAVILALAAAISYLLDKFVEWVNWVTDTAWPAVKKFFEDLDEAGGRSVNAVRGYFTALIDDVRDLPRKAADALSGIGSTLINAGKNLINGFTQGIREAIPSLTDLLGWITNMMPDWKGPQNKDLKLLQPAGEAVMEGFGRGLVIGADDIRALLGDFTSGIGGMGIGNNTNQNLFGANAVQVNFQGALPTTDQAMATGQAVGAGINNVIAARNTRLAVRSL